VFENHVNTYQGHFLQIATHHGIFLQFIVGCQSDGNN